MAERPAISAASLEAGREVRDASPRTIAAVAGFLALLLVLTMAAVRAIQPKPSLPESMDLPPDGPARDSVLHWTALVEPLEERRALARERLHARGWVDRDAGIARIPIDEAMRLVVGGVRPAGGDGAAGPEGER